MGKFPQSTVEELCLRFFIIQLVYIVKYILFIFSIYFMHSCWNGEIKVLSIIPKNTCSWYMLYFLWCTFLFVPMVTIFFCFVLFWSLSFHSRIVHSYIYVTITGDGLQIVTMLSTHGHWAVRVFQRATPTVRSVNNGHLRGPVTLTHIPECLSEELSLPVLTA